MFSIIRPFPSSTASVEIRRSGKVLLHLEPGAASPTISNLTVIPLLDSEFDKKIRVEWQASDPDGDELAYSVSYSVDQGKSFRPIEGGLKKTKLTLSTLGLGGSKSALLKVTASDGFNAVEVISEPFVLQATTAPIATILWPKRDHIFTSNKALLFRGTALDLQDGVLDGKNLEWFLVEPKEEHLLGNGSELLIKSLLTGKHTIRLVATNRDSEIGTYEQEKMF